MPTFHFVTKSPNAGAPASSPPCVTIDEALRGAKFMLGNGADSVWIVDGDGKLILPADQVKLRLESLDAPLGEPISTPPSPLRS
jgi:hypothetical protein